MILYAYAACGVAAAIVTSVELAFRNQRHPFGDRRFKASAWWLFVVLIDAIVGCLMLLGAVAADVVDAFDRMHLRPPQRPAVDVAQYLEDPAGRGVQIELGVEPEEAGHEGFDEPSSSSSQASSAEGTS